MEDKDGAHIDPCAAYLDTSWHVGGSKCPEYVGVQAGGSDIMPLQTLLDAAGLEDLDSPGGVTDKAGRVETFRYAGLILVVTITYYNDRPDRQVLVHTILLYTHDPVSSSSAKHDCVCRRLVA